MSERVVETQVIEVKLRGAPDLKALEVTATKARDSLEAARAKLAALAKQAKGFGPPTQIEAARDAVDELGAAAKKSQAELAAAAKAQRAEAQRARAETKAATDAERARTREAVKGARERARAEREASESARAAMADRVDDAKKYARALAEARAQAEALSAAQGAWRGKALSIGRAAGIGALGGAARALGGAATAAVAGGLAIGGGALGEIVHRGAEFEAQRATLANRLGGRQAADERIAELRATRGVSTGEGIAVTNRLEGLGLDSSVRSVKALSAIGANTPGKGATDAAEALADAGTGEFERLKELGFKAKVEGDKVAVTFRGVTEQIDKGAAAFQAYFTRIAEAKLSDALELKANSLAGTLEKLQDKITQAASAIYDSGLGDAIKAVVADIGGYFEISGEGAKGLGQVLGDAVRRLWERIKELIGPVHELPEKIGKVIKAAADFAEVALKIVGVLGSVVETLGTTNTAFVALGAAGLAALGPWGAAAAAAVLAISTIADALRDTTAEARKLAEQTARVAQTEIVKKQLTGDLGEDEENVARLRKGLQDRKNANKRSGSRSLTPESIKRDAEKRAEDAKEIEVQEAAIAEAEAKIAKKKRDAQKAIDDAADKAKADEIAAANAESEKISDTEEFAYLSRKKNKTPSQKKRLNELSKKLDKSIPKAGKAEHSALEGKIDAEIKQRAQAAGEVAGLRALREGSGRKEASALALRTEKEVTERLRGQVDRGQLLPGQINANVLALARVEDVASRGTPPPIAVTNVGPVTVNVPVEVTGNTINADARQIGIEVRRVVKGVMVEETRDAIRRVTSGVKG